MKKKLLCILTIICLFLGGCSYGKDVDEQSFVIAVGIDKGESFPLRVTFVFANPSGSGSGGGGGPSGYGLGKGAGPDHGGPPQSPASGGLALPDEGRGGESAPARGRIFL